VIKWKTNPLAQLGGVSPPGSSPECTQKMDYSEYGGAPLLGVNGICIVCHGKSNPKAIFNAIRVAGELVQKGTNQQIRQELQPLESSREANGPRPGPPSAACSLDVLSRETSRANHRHRDVYPRPGDDQLRSGKIGRHHDAWITTRTGIKERRIAAKNQATSDLAVKAAHKALDDAKVSPDALQLYYRGYGNADMFFPSTACFVQKALGIKEAVSFDVSAACSGFSLLGIARRMLEEGPYKTALIVGAGELSAITTAGPFHLCLFGDGAGAAVLQRRPGPKGILSTYVCFRCDSCRYSDGAGLGSARRRPPTCRQAIEHHSYGRPEVFSSSRSLK